MIWERIQRSVIFAGGCGSESWDIGAAPWATEGVATAAKHSIAQLEGLPAHLSVGS